MLTVAWIAVTGAQVTSADTQKPDVNRSGTWEGLIEDAVRPIVVQVHFHSGKANFDSAGPSSFPLERLVDSGSRVGFQVQIGNHRFDCDGQGSQREIRGTVRFGAREVPFWLRRLPELPAPEDRVEAWQQDLAALTSRFLLYDRGFSPDARKAFRRHIEILRPALREMSDQAIMVELARTLALARNGHTRLYLLRNRTEVRQLPIRVWWFKDSLSIVRATNDLTDLLGCRILKIGALPVAEAFARVRDLHSGSDSWQRYMSAYFLTSPDVLFGAGIIPESNRTTLSLSCGNQLREVQLAPLPLHKSASPDEAWWDLAPSYRDPTYNLISALKADKAPFYLRKPQENYWSQYIPEERIL